MPRFDPTSLCLFAQEERRHTLVTWAIEAMGPFYSLVLPATGIAIFIGAILVVALNRRPSVIAAYLVLLPLPTLIGIYGSVQGLITAFSEAAVAGGEMTGGQEATAWATSLFTTQVGLLVSFPGYLVLAIGLLVRTIYWRAEMKD